MRHTSPNELIAIRTTGTSPSFTNSIVFLPRRSGRCRRAARVVGPVPPGEHLLLVRRVPREHVQAVIPGVRLTSTHPEGARYPHPTARRPARRPGPAGT
jgi:hypothetical protein